MPIGPVRVGTRADSSTTTIGVPYPASVVAGELLVIFHSGSLTTTVTTPQGWTAEATVSASSQARLTVLYKVAAGGETGNLTVTQSAANATAQMFAIPGVDTTAPLDAATTTAATSAVAAAIVLPAVTAVTAGALPLYGVAESTGTTHTGPPGSTGLADFGAAAPTPPRWGAVYQDTSTVGTGSTGTRTITPNAARHMAAAMLLLRPASGAPTITTTGAVPVGAQLAGSAVAVLVTTGSLPANAALSGTPVTVRVTTGAIPVSAALAGTAVAGASTAGSLPANAALTGTAIAVRVTTGTVPVGAALSGAGSPVLSTTGSVPANAALTGAAGPVITATGSTPVVVGLAGVATVSGTTSGILPVAVALTGTTRVVRVLAGALPVAVQARGVGVSVLHITTGRIEVNAALSGTATVIRSATGTLPVTALLRGTAPDRLTSVTFQLVDASDLPEPRVHVRVRLVTAGAQLDDSEVARPYETYTNALGEFTLPLIPSSRFVVPGVYEVTWRDRAHRITVPDVGPVNLYSVLV